MTYCRIPAHHSVLVPEASIGVWKWYSRFPVHSASIGCWRQCKFKSHIRILRCNIKARNIIRDWISIYSWSIVYREPLSLTRVLLAWQFSLSCSDSIEERHSAKDSLGRASGPTWPRLPTGLRKRAFLVPVFEINFCTLVLSFWLNRILGHVA